MPQNWQKRLDHLGAALFINEFCLLVAIITVIMVGNQNGHCTAAQPLKMTSCSLVTYFAIFTTVSTIFLIASKPKRAS
jgi:hypothetical protein